MRCQLFIFLNKKYCGLSQDINKQHLCQQFRCNKFMASNKHGLINILFQEEAADIRIQKRNKQWEKYQIEKLTEQSQLLSKNRLKNMRIYRFNDSYFQAYQTFRKERKPYKKMYVDGSRISDIISRKELLSQSSQRKQDQYRCLSPDNNSSNQEDIGQTHFSLFQEKIQEIRQNREGMSRELASPSVEKDNRTSSPKQLVNSSKFPQSRRTIRSRNISRVEKKGEDTITSIQIKKQLFRMYSNPYYSPENITAKAFIVYEHFKVGPPEKNAKYLLAAFNSKLSVEIASLTKIMTCILTIEICQKYKINITTQQVQIGHFETKVDGTTAEIISGDSYTVQQLLYGMMLPSGNDASIALSVFCGQILSKNSVYNHKYNEGESPKLSKKNAFQKFVLEMNKKSWILGMKRTVYSNPHGLPNCLNKSCASDLVALIDYALRKPLFRQIVSCTYFEAKINVKKNKRQNNQNEQRSIKWQNTHKLIHTMPEFYKGIKTGITDAAGPCLASLIVKDNRQFIIVVLNSSTLKGRYKDTQKLRHWLFKRQELIIESKQKEKK